MPALSEIRFRRSPHVELKRLEDLAISEREPFAELERDPEFYGLFVAQPPLRMNLKAVARQTAQLFRKLSAPSQLDDALLRDEEVIDLVLDGILEIETGSTFSSGADALPILCPQAALPEIHDATARLSCDALLHAQDLETDDPQALTAALYSYNRIPLSPAWRARFPDRESVLSHVGADREPLRALLEREWFVSRERTSWWMWSSRTSTPSRNADHGTYKLYVSPRPERMSEVFAIVVRVLSDFRAVPFKIGDSAAGLLRPDKLVAYFRTREQLDEAADVLSRELAGCDAHGVPFSAGLDASGLLSWGVDPPENDRALRWLGRESWRYWLAQRLGAALSIAKNARGANAVEPWRFAIERARRHGVDVETWTPTAALWSRA
jgi:hypothetical protein